MSNISLLQLTHMENLIKKAHISGISAAIVIDGKLSQHIEVGKKTSHDDAKIKPDTVFKAASLSKPVFAYLVLRLVNEYGFDLDRPLNSVMEPERLAGQPYCNKLTARRILSHQSGFPGMDFGKEREFSFQYEPGKGFGYSGAAYYYLQKVIEKLTDTQLEALAQKWVFPYLATQHSTFLGSSNKEDVAISANSLQTTASDYAMFIARWMNEKNETFKEAFKPMVSMLKDSWAVEENVAKEDLEKLSWGLGWLLQKTNEGTIALHWGDMGDEKAFVAFNLETRKGIVYFASSFNALSIAREMAAPIVGNIDPAMNYLCKKFGYHLLDEANWEAKQQRQTWQRFAKHEVHDKLFWLAKLIKEEKLSIEDNKVLCTLTVKGDSDLLFIKLINYEFADFKENKELIEGKDCFVKHQVNPISLVKINIPNKKLYEEFIARLEMLALIPKHTAENPLCVDQLHTPKLRA